MKMNNYFFVNRPLEASDYSEHSVFVGASGWPLKIHKNSLKFKEIKKWCFLVHLGTSCDGFDCPLWLPEIPELPKGVTLKGCSIWIDSANNNDVAHDAERLEKLLKYNLIKYK